MRLPSTTSARSDLYDIVQRIRKDNPIAAPKGGGHFCKMVAAVCDSFLVADAKVGSRVRANSFCPACLT